MNPLVFGEIFAPASYLQYGFSTDVVQSARQSYCQSGFSTDVVQSARQSCSQSGYAFDVQSCSQSGYAFDVVQSARLSYSQSGYTFDVVRSARQSYSQSGYAFDVVKSARQTCSQSGYAFDVVKSARQTCSQSGYAFDVVQSAQQSCSQSGYAFDVVQSARQSCSQFGYAFDVVQSARQSYSQSGYAFDVVQSAQQSCSQSGYAFDVVQSARQSCSQSGYTFDVVQFVGVKFNPETTPDIDNNRSQTQKRPPTKKSRSDSPSPTRSIEEQLEPIRNKIEANPERYILSYEELKDFLENTFAIQNPETTPDIDNNRSQTQKRPPTKKSRSDSPSPTRSIEEQLEPIRNKIEVNPERYIPSYEELKDFLENTFGNNEPLSVAREYTDDISALLNMMYDLYTLISNQLPPPFILAGDFNAHNTLWGTTKDDRRGKQIENIIDNNATLLNDGSPTHLCTGSGNFSCIDITLCHPRLTPNITWETIPYLHGSDHFPIKLSLASPNIGTAQHQHPPDGT
ncbi:hypothetical protein CBL_08504 [Carabus blaptoides fortunei]